MTRLEKKQERINEAIALVKKEPGLNQLGQGIAVLSAIASANLRVNCEILDHLERQHR